MSERRPGPILVTGANSGIGLATVLMLASRGWTVYGTVRSEDKADELRRLARAQEVGRRVHGVVLDVSDHEAVVEAWKDLPVFYGVVNNAGYAESGAVEEVTAAQARRQLGINLIAPAVVASCALPGMRRRGQGRIVMVSSIAGRAAIMPLNAWYHASKFGLEALSDVLRVEVAAFGVKVVIVEPGFFRTNIELRAREKSGSRRRRDSPYAAAYERMDRLLDLVERVAPKPDAVARAIATALESRRPRRRYVVGLDALATVATQAFTPREITDFAMQLVGGLTGRSDKSS
jgi:NAD(P)-dependent dehydrogenase (short-subunit alcohol dehydrogenase family)